MASEGYLHAFEVKEQYLFAFHEALKRIVPVNKILEYAWPCQLFTGGATSTQTKC